MDRSSRDPNASVDFAVFDQSGLLLNDSGGIPLKAPKTGLLFTGDGPIVTISSTEYAVCKVAIMDRARHQRGTILVTRNVELEMEALHQSLVFNVVVAVAFFLLCGFVLVLEYREMS